MRRLYNPRFLRSLPVIASLPQMVRRTISDHDIWKLPDQKSQGPAFLKREHKTPLTDPVFSSPEYQNVMQMVRQISVTPTNEETFDFVRMINDKNEWIMRRVLEGMSPTDALAKMNALIHIRNIDKTRNDWRVNNDMKSVLSLSIEFRKMIIQYAIDAEYQGIDFRSNQTLSKYHKLLLKSLKENLEPAKTQVEFQAAYDEFFRLFRFYRDEAIGLTNPHYSFGDDLYDFCLTLDCLVKARTDFQNRWKEMVIDHFAFPLPDFIDEAQRRGISVVHDFHVFYPNRHTDEAFSSMRGMLDDTPTPTLTENDSAEFKAMINDRETWILNEMVKGVDILDAFKKMQALICLRDLNVKYNAQKTSTESQHHSPKTMLF